jgi:hypothetical protein
MLCKISCKISSVLPIAFLPVLSDVESVEVLEVAAVLLRANFGCCIFEDSGAAAAAAFLQDELPLVVPLSYPLFRRVLLPPSDLGQFVIDASSAIIST